MTLYRFMPSFSGTHATYVVFDIRAMGTLIIRSGSTEGGLSAGGASRHTERVARVIETYG